MNKIFNIVGFQASWWGCVLGVKAGMIYLGPILMLTFLAIHVVRILDKYAELKLIILFGFIGTLIDTSMAYFGILTYNGTYFPDTNIAPLWITSMWCGFSATVNHSLSWLHNRYAASAILGIISGPLSYLAGVKFGAIEFDVAPITAIVIISIYYGLTVPVMYWVNEKLVISSN